ncbi:MAG: carboxylating nicotinate-nucleotide diphosphorylase [Bryobacteraceae bacterium]|jgi:nicotinate-nucleotide pyrophosphorylase (carboxylating)
MPFEVSHLEVREAVHRALAEDIGQGDITTELTVDAARHATGSFFAREPLVLAGVELLPLVYEAHGGVDHIDIQRLSGSNLVAGVKIAEVRGPARTLLTCERVALNFLQRLSGVATLASRYVRAVEGTRCRVLDTRKTTPGLRRLEKMAAAAGGVTNHRMGLYDAVLIKNNHITAAGGVRAALEAVRKAGMPAEIEVRSRLELDEALEAGAQHLLLDNLTPAEAAEWIHVIDGRATAELSGGITLETAQAFAQTGADFISVGAITHSALAVDINFRLELS